jgi:hypothetical protein
MCLLAGRKTATLHAFRDHFLSNREGDYTPLTIWGDSIPVGSNLVGWLVIDAGIEVDVNYVSYCVCL